jgi:hypothetical protein
MRGKTLTIPDLLERHQEVVKFDFLPNFGPFVVYKYKRMDVWKQLSDAHEQGLRKVPSLLIRLSKYQHEMEKDELRMLNRFIKKYQDNESSENLSWTRISLHMDTLSQLDRAATRKGVSKSELAEIAIREYCKAIGIV